MDGVSLREAGEQLPALIERVERGEDVVILRDGVPVARLVREMPPAAALAKRVLTPEQQRALDESIAMLKQGWPLGVGHFDRDEIYADRLERQHKPWRD
jgi:antitoxin (DNA-binding transcriptional repressor) of toxin-antitoxin stability system